MKTSLLVPLLCAAACGGPDYVSDPGFFLNGSVTANQRLDFAPVLVQAFADADLDVDGNIAAGARPFIATPLSGPIAPGDVLPFGIGGLGCARPARVLAWVDVDGDSAQLGEGDWAYAARPGPGDLVALPPIAAWQDATPDACTAGPSGPIDAVAHSPVFGVGDSKTHVELDVDAGAAPFNLSFSALAYDPADIIKGRPCTTCAPLFTLSTHEAVWNADSPSPHSFEIDAPAVPMRVWIEGTMNGNRYGALTSATLFEGETGTRGRSAIAVPIAFQLL